MAEDGLSGLPIVYRNHIPRAGGQATGRVTEWSVSFRFQDSTSEMPWPSGQQELALCHWISVLNRLDWCMLLNEQLDDGRTTLKACEIEELNAHAKKRFDELLVLRPQLEALVSDRMYELTYCANTGDPRRLLGLYSESTFYVLWWDPEHRAFGLPFQTGRSPGGPCASQCRHLGQVQGGRSR